MPSVVGQITKGAVFDVLIDADAVGGDAGANTLPDDTVALSNVTQHNPTIAAAAIADNAVLRGDGGARGVQDSTVTIADDGVMSVPGIGDGGLTNYDLLVGDVTTPSYGMIRIGNAVIGRTSYNVGSIDLDGAILVRNIGGPVTGDIEFLVTESVGNTARFAIPTSGIGKATYHARSVFIAGPAPANTDFVKVSYWQTQGIFHNLTCDTTGLGADLGVQHDLEVENDIFVDSILESTTAAGVTIDGVLLKDGLVDGVDVSAHAALTTDPHGSAMTISVLLICPLLSNFGDITLDASAATDTKVWIKNNDTGRADLDVDRNIIVGGTVDGRDIATDGTKLDGIATGANLYVHPNHSGDVTSVADGAQTIASDAVTYDKMQDASATDKVLGRSTAGAGTVEEIPCTAAGRALIDDADTAAQRTTLDVYDRSTVIAMAVALG